jgi:hypothetical protein
MESKHIKAFYFFAGIVEEQKDVRKEAKPVLFTVKKIK